MTVSYSIFTLKRLSLKQLIEGVHRYFRHFTKVFHIPLGHRFFSLFLKLGYDPRSGSSGFLFFCCAPKNNFYKVLERKIKI